MVSTPRCGRGNLGSNPSFDTFCICTKCSFLSFCFCVSVLTYRISCQSCRVGCLRAACSPPLVVLAARPVIGCPVPCCGSLVGRSRVTYGRRNYHHQANILAYSYFCSLESSLQPDRAAAACCVGCRLLVVVKAFIRARVDRT